MLPRETIDRLIQKGPITVSNGTDLRVSKSLELLDRLEKSVTEFSRKEEQLTADQRTRQYKTNRKYSLTLQETEERLDERLGKLEEAAMEQAEQLKQRFANRKQRIQKGLNAGLRNLPKRVEQARGGWLGNLQRQKLRLEKEIGAAKQVAKQEFTERSQALEELKGHLVGLAKEARHSLKGYESFVNLLKPATASEPKSMGPLPELSAAVEGRLNEFQQLSIPGAFSMLPLFGWLLVGLAIGSAVAFFGRDKLGDTNALVAGGGLGLLLIIATITLYKKGGQQGRPAAEALAKALLDARQTYEADCASAMATHEQKRSELQERLDRGMAEIQTKWDQTDEVEKTFAETAKRKLDQQVPRALAKADVLLLAQIHRLEQSHQATVTQLKREAQAVIDRTQSAQNKDLSGVTTEDSSEWESLEHEWKRRMISTYQGIEAMNAATAERYPAWSGALVQQWQPVSEFMPATKFGHFHLDLTQPPHTAPKDPRLALPGSADVQIPLCLTYPHQGSLLFETNEAGDGTVGSIFNNVILRLLATTPPGKLSFTIVDPVGLGQNFAGLMHLSDYEDSLINRRIWTQRDQIEDRLGELSEHIEKVIQMYLRNEYATITEYNEKAGSVAEKYHFLVVADFPSGFSEVATRRLMSIATSGPRCGVYTLIHWDQRHQSPDGFAAADLRQNSIRVLRQDGKFYLQDDVRGTAAPLEFDAPPAPELALDLVHKIGKSSIDANRVQVPFEQIAPIPSEEWTSETTDELRIPIGRTGATKFQILAIGKGTRQHALFAGKTGSGKSTLFHVIITNLALACSPDQVEFYLIDFKKGVEFKCYATQKLPHAKVVAIESDREFALSVLQRVDHELKRRGDLFRKLGCQDVAGYKRMGGTEPMPRSLLLIDEFQEFFVEDDAIAQSASLLFDRIVRQGRAFGIHVLLGSQTLGGAYSLARATLGQMVIRVALQCNEADAYLIMDENNSAPRLLSRPGEGIYNDSAGALEGNSPFQVVWLSDEERDAKLRHIRELAIQHQRPLEMPIVFEGNAPADITENTLLATVLAGKPTQSPIVGKAWLGAPNSIKGPTEARFQRQSGNHLLIVGQREEVALNLLGVSILALAAQYPAGKVQFVIFQNNAPGSEDDLYLEKIAGSVPHPVTMARGQDIGEAMSALAADMKERTTSEAAAQAAPTTFLLIHGLHKFKKLRQEDDFSFSMSDDAGESTGAQFSSIITEGSGLGIHIITTVDTFNNVNRSMNRKALSEFEMRVVFQMSANDSASLIDTPKASTLGLHRALYYNEQEGTLETFRPYATPDNHWLAEAKASLLTP